MRAGTLRYGWTPIETDPGLWGGFAQYLYLHPRAMVHRVPDGVPPRFAAMALPLGNGVQWACFDGGAAPGTTVVVQGPGQQGLACAIAAKAAGARVIVTGLARDAHRLDVAKRLGADLTVRVDDEDLVGAVRDATGGTGAELVIDVTSARGSTVVNAALEVAAKRGTVLLAAYKGGPLDGIALDTVIRRQVTVKGVRGHSYRAIDTALAMMAEKRVDLAPMATHELPLDEVDRAIRMVSGELQDDAIHVAITP
jgi:threonine dehydrogenase-like Zn-dependent dehydrogenase